MRSFAFFGWEKLITSGSYFSPFRFLSGAEVYSLKTTRRFERLGTWLGIFSWELWIFESRSIYLTIFCCLIKREVNYGLELET